MAFVRFAEVRTWLEDDDMMGHVGHALVVSHVGRGAMTNIIFHNSIRTCSSQPLAGTVFRSAGDLGSSPIMANCEIDIAIYGASSTSG